MLSVTANKNAPRVLSGAEYNAKNFRSTQYEKDMMRKLDAANEILKEISPLDAAVTVHRSLLQKHGRALYDLVAVVVRNGITSYKTVAKGLTTSEIEIAAATYVDTVKMVINDFGLKN